MRRSLVRLVAAAATVGALVVIVDCSLGLDESKIGAIADTGAPDTGLVDGPDLSPDTGTSPDAAIATTSCTGDADCARVTGACLHSRCDLARNVCVYDVCRESACSAGVCDQGACGSVKPYGFKAYQFAIGAPLVSARALVVAHPYMFAGTANGVVVYNIANPTLSPPPVVAMTGLAFVPTYIVASGGRVYFVGNTTGSGAAPSRLPIAWVDVPADPTAQKLTASSTLASYSRPSTESPTSLLPRTSDSAYLLGAATLYQTAILQAPFDDIDSVDAAALPITVAHDPKATSATRIVTGTKNPQGVATFGIVSNGGTAQAQNGGDTTLPDAGYYALTESFSQSPSGAVFWTAGLLTTPRDTPIPMPTIRAAHGYFLVKDAQSGFDATAGIDFETYPAIYSSATVVVGPNVLIDAEQALVTALAHESATQTSVQIIRRNPLGIVPNADNSPRRVLLPVAVSSFVGAAASNGLAYLAASDPPGNTTIFAFDPGCAP